MRTKRVDLWVPANTYWEQLFKFVKTSRGKEPYPITGRSVVVKLSSGPELKEGSGLTVTKANGEVETGLYVTAGNTGSYRVEFLLEGQSGAAAEPLCPVWGALTITQNPN